MTNVTTTDASDAPMIIEAYTDGACKGNPGPGGWAYTLTAKRGDEVLKSVSRSGGYDHTTNNAMELEAIYRVLSALNHPAKITVYSDSQYAINCISMWGPAWARNNWVKDRGPIQNLAVLKKLITLTEMHDVTFVWVKGHSGNLGNEIVDRMATDAIPR